SLSSFMEKGESYKELEGPIFLKGADGKYRRVCKGGFFRSKNGMKNYRVALDLNRRKFVNSNSFDIPFSDRFPRIQSSDRSFGLKLKKQNERYISELLRHKRIRKHIYKDARKT